MLSREDQLKLELYQAQSKLNFARQDGDQGKFWEIIKQIDNLQAKLTNLNLGQ